MTQNADVWLRALHERIAKAVKDARGQRSAQQVAEETARLGYPISRSRIANYESGRKLGLDVAELLVLGAALGVPPVTLIFGGPPEDTVEVLPGLTVPFVSALAWFTGDESLAWSRPGLGLTDPESRNAKLLHLIRDRELKHRDLVHARAVATVLGDEGDEEGFAPAITRVAELFEDIQRLDKSITEYSQHA
jgi:transcriptional regulator with XRE-family HTH domain